MLFNSLDRLSPPMALIVSPLSHRSRPGSDPLLTTLKSSVGAVVLPLLPFNRRTFDILRHEMRTLRTRMANAISPTYRASVRRLRSQRDLSLNVGSGGRGLPDWVNIEMIQMRDTTLCLDIRQRLPLADGSVARILAEHVVEHIDFRSDVPRVFRDWHRVLQPGGVVRIIVPDARRFLQAYVSDDKAAWQRLGWDVGNLPEDIFTPMHVINHIFHQGGEHLFAYDFETLALALRQAGFATVEQMAFMTSRDPKLVIDQENHAPYSLYVEAVKQT